MNIVIVFDSHSGNTEKIAEAMGAALQSTHNTMVVRADSANEQTIKKANAVIVGSPTHRFQATEATMEFLKNLPEGSLEGKQSAAFDTRIQSDTIKPGVLKFFFKLGSYASKPIANWLQVKGSSMPILVAGFYVTAEDNPHLEEGELERAEQWAVNLFN